MRRVWLSCAECGRQRVPYRDVALILCETRRVFHVSWRCLDCGRATTMDLTDRGARSLIRSGLGVVTLRLPHEQREPRPDLGALSVEDFELWRAALHAPGQLEGAVAELDDGSPQRP